MLIRAGVALNRDQAAILPLELCVFDQWFRIKIPSHIVP